MIATGHHVAERTAGPVACERGGGGRRPAWTWALFCCGLVGCSSAREATDAGIRVSHRPFTTIAVAPALNFSGSREFDPVRVADLMASELSSFPGIGVVGVNRVLAILAEQGFGQVQSPEHALEIADRLGVDAILVFAVTEYEAHTPVVGVAAQLYGLDRREVAIDPVATSRAARPFPVVGTDERLAPRAQIQRTFNAAHDFVRHDVEAYAEQRNGGDSPYGWRKFIASQEWYLRYCCFAVVRELMVQQSRRPDAVETAAMQERDP